MFCICIRLHGIGDVDINGKFQSNNRERAKYAVLVDAHYV